MIQKDSSWKHLNGKISLHSRRYQDMWLWYRRASKTSGLGVRVGPLCALEIDKVFSCLTVMDIEPSSPSDSRRSSRSHNMPPQLIVRLKLPPRSLALATSTSTISPSLPKPD